MKKFKIDTQTHHIKYSDPEWTVELQKYHHRLITTIQNATPTAERYMWLTNLMHALMHEYNRYRMYLDTNGKVDLNELFGYSRKKRKKKSGRAKRRVRPTLG